MSKLSFPFLLAFLLIAGCVSNQLAHDTTHPPQLPIKIGLLADSQITSEKGSLDCHYRNKSLDKNLEKTIRPPALEYLTKSMLRIALNKFPTDVNVILYLGDGANSGGTDEIKRLFKVLGRYREKTKIPIFMVIGNHDYLGVGNATQDPERHVILHRDGQPKNPALSKYEVLNKISKFNGDPNYLCPNTMFKYTDCNDDNPLNPKLGHEGLYLAGHLQYSATGKDDVEIFLVDSSDYNDTPPLSIPNLKIWESFRLQIDFYGVKGSISSKDKKYKSGKERMSQISYFEDKSRSSSAHFRFIASHYHADYLDRNRYLAHNSEEPAFGFLNLMHGIWETAFGLIGWRYARQHLSPLLLDGGKNYWLSAHTHRKRMKKEPRIDIGGIFGMFREGSFSSINIGSTTDYRAHVAVVEPFSNDAKENIVLKDKPYLQVREIPLFDYNEPLLDAIHEGIEDYGCNHKNKKEFEKFLNNPTKRKRPKSQDYVGMTILGLNKEYQEDDWLQEHTTASTKNLEEFIENFIKVHKKEYSRADVVTCLAFIAGACEAGVCNCKKGFDLNKCNFK